MITTPDMRSIARRMDLIHQAAEARSSNPYFWDYTPAELAELAALHRQYMAAKAAAGL